MGAAPGGCRASGRGCGQAGRAVLRGAGNGRRREWGEEQELVPSSFKKPKLQFRARPLVQSMAKRTPEGLGLILPLPSPSPQAAALASLAGRQSTPFAGFYFGFVSAQNSSHRARGLLRDPCFLGLAPCFATCLCNWFGHGDL